MRWNTTHILNYVCVLCPATLSDQPTEAVPVWEQLISSRCATPMSARISTVTRERSNAMLGTLTLSYIATSTTGCLMNTQTVSVHPQMEREWEMGSERGRHPKYTSLRMKNPSDDTQQKFQKRMKARKRKQTHNCWMRLGFIYRSLTSGYSAE